MNLFFRTFRKAMLSLLFLFCVKFFFCSLERIETYRHFISAVCSLLSQIFRSCPKIIGQPIDGTGVPASVGGVFVHNILFRRVCASGTFIRFSSFFFLYLERGVVKKTALSFLYKKTCIADSASLLIGMLFRSNWPTFWTLRFSTIYFVNNKSS